MLLVSFDDNYADEFDISGWFVCSEEDWVSFKLQSLGEYPQEQLDKRGCFYLGFGTNEGIEYDSLEDYFSKFTIKEISSADAEVLIRLFNCEMKKVNDSKFGIYFDLRCYGDVLNPFN